CGHCIITTGVLSFDTQEGFWLVHSTPHFPPNRTMGWAWPDSAMDYGQAFLCVSYPIAMMEKIGEQFLYTYPKIYDKNFPASFAAKSPVMNQILGDKQSHVKQLPWYHKTTLVSKAGHNFVSYAKFGKFMADLYDNLVAIDLQSDMMVETWQKGGVKENLPTNCSIQYKVYKHYNCSIKYKVYKHYNCSIKYTVYKHDNCSIKYKVYKHCNCSIKYNALQLFH
ncbi:deoxyribonuclease-2-alpha-like, partial [Mizuhopecten yessoensis]|uniref:deoxyribonuclease-2-alpha-like n=1 Tax=Mizuhopecten yessoensis TaxID=6573 RepID=UPI000B457145